MTADSGPVDFVTGAPTSGSLEVVWAHGARRRRQEPARDPGFQVHHYDEHTVILRQSMSVSHEAPFLYLLFGNERALLMDTGAVADPRLAPLRATVDTLVADWLDAHPREGYELVVAHSHGHHDHVAADAQFADRPATTVVPRDADAVRAFFGFGAQWPAQSVAFDLGGRVLDVLGSPGHHEAAVTFYDPWTGILLTGDTVVPGRLFAFDGAAYLATLERLAAFAATRPVTHVLGCHVEMAREPGRIYPLGALYQPDERAPRMAPAHLAEVRDAVASVAGARGVFRFDDFVLYQEPRPLDLLRLMAHGLALRVRGTLAGHSGRPGRAHRRPDSGT